jgi:predicted RNA-binding protein YlqC (UPF0109 family)
MSSIDQQFIEFVVKSLVNNPDAVEVARRIDEKGVLLELTVDPEDLGRVIGKRGGTAQSIRTLLRALGTKNDARYNLKIIDNGTGGSYHHDDQNGSSDDHHADHSDQSERPDTNQAQSGHSIQSTMSSDDDTDSISSTTRTLDDLDDGDSQARHHHSDKENEESDVVSKTRRELKDLDDLDI